MQAVFGAKLGKTKKAPGVDTSSFAVSRITGIMPFQQSG
jgi:hypothetical protein